MPPPVRSLLVVRLSAFGDQLQTAPLVTDLARRFPGCAIDWAVDERFAAVPRRHRHVRRVIALPLKRLQSATLGQRLQGLAGALRELRRERYDAVLDAQGLWKSALVARLAHARERVGFDARHCGEPPAARLYGRRIAVSMSLHGTRRLRALGAAAFGTDACAAIDYGMDWADPPIEAAIRGGPGSPGLVAAAAGAIEGGADDAGRDRSSAGTVRFAVLVHGASRPHKLWEAACWVALGRHLAARGLRVVLPWGDEGERRVAQQLAEQIGPACVVPPHAPVEQWAATLALAALVVGVDTGLTNLAASAGAPTLALFTGTPPTGFAPADQRSRTLGGPGESPSAGAVIAAADAMLDAAVPAAGNREA